MAYRRRSFSRTRRPVRRRRSFRRASVRPKKIGYRM